MTQRPDMHPDAALSFAQACAAMDAGRPMDAVDPLVECLRLAPDFGPGYVNLACVLRQFGMLGQAEAMAQAAVALLPGDRAALLCLAAVRYDSADFPGAAALYEALLAQDPHHPGVLSSLGNSLVAMGRLAEALPVHARAVAAAPGDAEAHYNRADALLAAGAYASGWAEYEWRLRRAGVAGRGFGPAWDGAALEGGTLLLHAEQGFGDTLQFARYAPMAAARGARVVLEVQPALLRLMRSLPGVAQVVAQGDGLPDFAAHCPLMSLPHVFGTQLGTVPAVIPYLHAEADAIAAWRRSVPADGRLRVGLVWAGSAHPTATSLVVYDARRSLPLAALAALGSPGVQLISLQTGRPAEQLREPPAGLCVLDPMGEVTDFADTAALVATLDLVISVDTAVAHLAGALGRPVWLLSRSDGCWRWLTRRDDSPWYPTMRLYRQERPHAWDSVVARLGTDLAALAAAHSSGTATATIRPLGRAKARAQVSSINPALQASATDSAASYARPSVAVPSTL